MQRPPVPIMRTGAANLASVTAAFRRLGVSPEITESPELVEHAERLVVPGVGSFGAVMRRLDELGVTEPLRRRIRAGRPTLGICLGMQILFEASDESPGVAGLGILPGRVERFPHTTGLRIPHMGWNAVGSLGEAYFTHSYRLAAVAGGRTHWATDHAGPFVSMVQPVERVLATQFHPELSGPFGAALLRDWLAGEPPATLHRGGEEPPTARAARPRVIPCLDVRDGRVVKGVRFQNLRDAGDPVELAALYDRDGADELVILDVSATTEGRANAAHTVAAVRDVLSIPLTVGGGVRTAEDAARLLDAGADKVATNTAAVDRPELIGELAGRFGVQCTVLAVDAARREAGEGWEVVTRAGTRRTGIDAVGWCVEAERRGAGEILLTSWDRDGTKQGYDLPLLGAVAEAIDLPVIASGGAANAAHLAEGFRAGATGALAASIFHDAETTVATIKRELRGLGVLPRGEDP